MTLQEQLQEAFSSLDEAPPSSQALLQPVLVRLMSDPDTLRVLDGLALGEHLEFLARVLRNWAALEPESRAGLPPRHDIFLGLVVGTGLQDADEAYSFVMGLPSGEREPVEQAVSVALGLPGQVSPSRELSLLAIARLLRLALVRSDAVTHLAAGGAVEPFLPSTPAGGTRRKPQPRPAKRAPNKRLAKGPTAPRPSERWLDAFAGKLVQVTVMLPVDLHGSREVAKPQLVSILGVCLEVGPNHIVLDVRPDLNEAPQPVVFGLAHIAHMREVSDLSLRPA